MEKYINLIKENKDLIIKRAIAVVASSAAVITGVILARNAMIKDVGSEESWEVFDVNEIFEGPEE